MQGLDKEYSKPLVSPSDGDDHDLDPIDIRSLSADPQSVIPTAPLVSPAYAPVIPTAPPESILAGHQASQSHAKTQAFKPSKVSKPKSTESPRISRTTTPSRSLPKQSKKNTKIIWGIGLGVASAIGIGLAVLLTHRPTSSPAPVPFPDCPYGPRLDNLPYSQSFTHILEPMKNAIFEEPSGCQSVIITSSVNYLDNPGTTSCTFSVNSVGYPVSSEPTYIQAAFNSTQLTEIPTYLNGFVISCEGDHAASMLMRNTLTNEGGSGSNTTFIDYVPASTEEATHGVFRGSSVFLTGPSAKQHKESDTSVEP